MLRSLIFSVFAAMRSNKAEGVVPSVCDYAPDHERRYFCLTQTMKTKT